jgi:endoglucanase
MNKFLPERDFWRAILFLLVQSGCGSSGPQSASNGSGAGAPSSNGSDPTGSNSSGNNAAIPVSGQEYGASGFLHVQGNRLIDAADHNVRLTGANWFGFETSNLSPHGLWARDYRSMLKQIRAVGFNVVRLPWCDAMLKDGAQAQSVNTYGPDPYDGTDPMNGPLAGKAPIEIMDLVVEAAGEVGLRIILDNHSRDPDGYMNEQVWYTSSVSEAQWIADWKFMAERYRGNPTVVGFDLDNEPHGQASWGTGNATTDWNSAAERCGNAILQVNPDALIVVEGVEKVGTDSYWWGSNLTGVHKNPIALSRPEKLVYSAHEYGPEVHDQPWFSASTFPDNMRGIWNDKYGFIMQEQLGHVLIGEFGIKDPTAMSGKEGTWFDSFLKYGGAGLSWTFWCWNPNSGDTEGILDYDWLTPKQWKLDALKPYLAPQ